MLPRHELIEEMQADHVVALPHYGVGQSIDIFRIFSGETGDDEETHRAVRGIGERQGAVGTGNDAAAAARRSVINPCRTIKRGSLFHCQISIRQRFPFGSGGDCQ